MRRFAPARGISCRPGFSAGVLLWLLPLLSAVSLPSQEPQAPAGQRPPTLRADVDLVLVPVTVMDERGRMVSGLEREHFEVLEDGVAQEIRYLSNEDAPVSLGVVYDVSGSMRLPLGRRFRRLGLDFIVDYMKTAPPEDEFFVVVFSSEPRLLFDFTRAGEEVLNRLFYVEAGGRTALWDGVYMAVNNMRKANNPRKAILVISDGMENHSRYSLKDVRYAVREADTQVYAIGTEPLTGVAHMTGGRVFSAWDLRTRRYANDMGDIVEKISQELRNQYVLGYRSTNKKKDGTWRKIQVKVLRPRGAPQLEVYARSGYYAGVD